MANEGLQTKPYCTVPAVCLLRKMAMTVKRQPQYGTKTFLHRKFYQEFHVFKNQFLKDTEEEV